MTKKAKIENDADNPVQPELISTRPRWGYSLRHDRALDLCIAKFPSCPFGCAKNGAPNCDWNVAANRCEPAKQTVL